MKIPFKTDGQDGDEMIMELGNINPSQIRFNIVTREIFVVHDPVPEYGEMHWVTIKKLVVEKGGTWVNKAKGIAFLEGK